MGLAGTTWSNRWPELLEGLTAEQQRSVIGAVASNVLSGWEPSREDIQALVDVETGQMSTEEYLHAVLVQAGVR